MTSIEERLSALSPGTWHTLHKAHVPSKRLYVSDHEHEDNVSFDSAMKTGISLFIIALLLSIFAGSTMGFYDGWDNLLSVISKSAVLAAFVLGLPFFSGVAVYKKRIDIFYKKHIKELTAALPGQYHALINRPHRKSIPDGSHNQFALYIDIPDSETSLEQIQIIESQTQKNGSVQWRVLHSEKAPEDVDQATRKATELSLLAEEAELHTWEQFNIRDNEEARAAIEKQLISEQARQRRQALTQLTGQRTASK